MEWNIFKVKVKMVILNFVSTENIFKSEGEIKMFSKQRKQKFSFSRPARRKMMP